MTGDRAPSSLCLVPWIHAHVDPRVFRACAAWIWRGAAKRCGAGTRVSTPSGTALPLRAVRRQMLSGMLPERCRCAGATGTAASR